MGKDSLIQNGLRARDEADDDARATRSVKTGGDYAAGDELLKRVRSRSDGVREVNAVFNCALLRAKRARDEATRLRGSGTFRVPALRGMGASYQAGLEPTMVRTPTEPSLGSTPPPTAFNSVRRMGEVILLTNDAIVHGV